MRDVSRFLIAFENLSLRITEELERAKPVKAVPSKDCDPCEGRGKVRGVWDIAGSCLTCDGTGQV